MTAIETMSALPRLSATSIIVNTNLTVYLCQWADNVTDELDVMARLSLPLQPHPASTGSFLTPAHYAKLYALMKSVRSAHQAGRVTVEQYTLYAEYFNAITEIAEAVHGVDTLDMAVATYTPPTTGKHSAGTTGEMQKKTSQMPSLLDVEADLINEPSAIYPDVITAIYNRQESNVMGSKCGYCVLSGVDYSIIPVLDWLNNTDNVYNGPIMPYSDPFDEVIA